MAFDWTNFIARLRLGAADHARAAAEDAQRPDDPINDLGSLKVLLAEALEELQTSLEVISAQRQRIGALEEATQALQQSTRADTLAETLRPAFTRRTSFDTGLARERSDRRSALRSAIEAEQNTRAQAITAETTARTQAIDAQAERVTGVVQYLQTSTKLEAWVAHQAEIVGVLAASYKEAYDDVTQALAKEQEEAQGAFNVGTFALRWGVKILLGMAAGAGEEAAKFGARELLNAINFQNPFERYAVGTHVDDWTQAGGSAGSTVSSMRMAASGAAIDAPAKTIFGKTVDAMTEAGGEWLTSGPVWSTNKESALRLRDEDPLTYFLEQQRALTGLQTTLKEYEAHLANQLGAAGFAAEMRKAEIAIMMRLREVEAQSKLSDRTLAGLDQAPSSGGLTASAVLAAFDALKAGGVSVANASRCAEAMVSALVRERAANHDDAAAKLAALAAANALLSAPLPVAAADAALSAALAVVNPNLAAVKSALDGATLASFQPFRDRLDGLRAQLPRLWRRALWRSFARNRWRGNYTYQYKVWLKESSTTRERCKGLLDTWTGGVWETSGWTLAKAPVAFFSAIFGVGYGAYRVHQQIKQPLGWDHIIHAFMTVDEERAFKAEPSARTRPQQTLAERQQWITRAIVHCCQVSMRHHRFSRESWYDLELNDWTRYEQNKGRLDQMPLPQAPTRPRSTKANDDPNVGGDFIDYDLITTKAKMTGHAVRGGVL